MAPDAAHPTPLREEIANALSHGLGGLLALLAMPALAAGPAGAAAGDPLRRAGLAVFGLTLLLMYGASTVYHALPAGPAKAWLRRLDHAAIFLFIAGSYTPFALARPDTDGHVGLLVAVWALALVGTALKLDNRLRHKGGSTALYLGFAWLIAAAALPLLAALPAAARTLLIAGGAAYTLGCVFFMLDRKLRYGHCVWHLFVIAGSACHLLAVQQLA